MNDIDLQKIRVAVSESVETTVNGKIRTLTEEFREYVKEDQEWRKKYEPYLEGLANLSGGAKIVVWIVMGIGAVAGAILSIKSFFK